MQDFFRSLFDFSFSSLVTPRIIRVVYIVLVAVIALSAVLMLVNGLTGDDANPVVALIRAPLSFLFFVVIARFYLELLIVIFKIGDDVRRIADQGLGGGRFGGPAPGPGPAGPGPAPGPSTGPRTFI